MELVYHKIPCDDEKKPNYEAVLVSDGFDDTHLGQLCHSTVTTPVGEFPCWQYEGRLGIFERKTLKELKHGLESELLKLIHGVLDKPHSVATSSSA